MAAAVLGKAAALAYGLKHKLLYTLGGPPKPPSKESIGTQKRANSRSAS